jgi:hypothetical protein
MVIRVDLPRETVDAVKDVARDNKISEAEAIRRMVERGKFIERESSRGNNILVERNGRIVRVTFEDK